MTFIQEHAPEYQVYTNMKTRCYNVGNENYPRYGARGIRVCDRWLQGDGTLTGFECFVRDLGRRPPGMTLERADNDGPYSPRNCRWASRKVQARNRRSSIYATVDGRTLCAQDWAKELGVSRNAFYTRARRVGCVNAVRHYQEHGVAGTKQ